LSGNAAQLPILTEHLSGPDPIAAKIAAQAISMIVGVDLGVAAFAADTSLAVPGSELPPPSEDPGARAALPPLHEDDLDADLVPLPEEGLPRPNAHAIRLFWEQRASSLAPGVRYLGGRPAGVDVSLDYVARAPLRRRHMLALGLGIQTGGRVWIDTRAFSATQRGQIARARGARPVMR
jgi:hypothetical protein